MGTVLGVIVAVGVVALLFLNKERDQTNAEGENGRALGEWIVYYDVPGQKIGLKAAFGEDQLLRYLIFRLHDLFSHYEGLRGEQGALAEAVRAAARGEASWALRFPPAEEDCFHAQNAREGTLHKFFEGTLFDGAITQPRFLGGDATAKQKGLVGECVAIAGYLAVRQPAAVVAAVEALVSQQLAEGAAPAGPRFWRRPVAALRQSTQA